MSRGKDNPGLFGMLREMLRDEPEEYVPPEEIDAQIDAERASEAYEDPDEVVDYIEPDSERAEEELRDAKCILTDMQVGCVCLSLLYLLGMLLVPTKIAYGIGVFIGFLVAVWMLWNMYESIEAALDMESQAAISYMRKRVAVRYLIIFAAVVGTILLGGKYMGLGAMLSIMNVKFSAYLQPLTNRIRRKIVRKGR